MSKSHVWRTTSNGDSDRSRHRAPMSADRQSSSARYNGAVPRKQEQQPCRYYDDDDNALNTDSVLQTSQWIFQDLHFSGTTFFPRIIIIAIQLGTLAKYLFFIFFASFQIHTFRQLNDRLKMDTVCRISIIIMSLIVAVICILVTVT